MEEIETYKDNRNLNERSYMLTIVDGNWSQAGNVPFMCYGQLTWEEVLELVDAAFKQGYEVAVSIDEIDEDEFQDDAETDKAKGK